MSNSGDESSKPYEADFSTPEGIKEFVEKDHGWPSDRTLKVEAFLKAMQQQQQQQQEPQEGDRGGSSLPPLVLDVRSPGEYLAGHIPGAMNVPLLNNVDRADVGTMFKQVGKGEAFELALERVQPCLQMLLEQVSAACCSSGSSEEQPAKRSLLVYCLRGGMRSRSTAKFLDYHGYDVRILQGGYKVFRAWAMDVLHRPRKLCIVGGATGSGKTEVLHELQALGEQVLDLEGLACHKGSVFGHLGEQPQPSSEHFRNMLAVRWERYDPKRFVFVEDEDSSIGTVHVPAPTFQHMRQTPVVVRLVVPFELRAQRSLDVYGCFGAKELEPLVTRFKKNMGAARTEELLDHLRKGELRPVCEAALTWYDRMYAQHLQKGRSAKSFLDVPVDSLDSSRAAADVLKAVRRLDRAADAPLFGAEAASEAYEQGDHADRGALAASCFCGHVTVGVRGDPESVSFCHCSICRRLSGAPFVASALFPSNSVELRRGRRKNAKDKSDTDKEPPTLLGSKTSRRVMRQRCGICFAPVLADMGGRVAVPLSLFAESLKAQATAAGGTKALPLAWRPQHHLHYSARVIDVDDGLAKFEYGAGGDLWVQDAEPGQAEEAEKAAASVPSPAAEGPQ